MERNLDVVNDLLTLLRNAIQNDLVVCITCLVSGLALILGYRIWIRRKGK